MVCMSTPLDSGDRDSCWLLPVSPVEGEVDVACTGMAGPGEASEWELCHFPSCIVGLGLGIVAGQPMRETIGTGAVCVV